MQEFLLTLIKTHTGERSWEENPRASLTLREGLLYVTQTSGVHREIEALLSRIQF